jgi:hypothetical protein
MTSGWKLVFIGGAIWSICGLASLAGSIQATNRDGSAATYDNTWAGLQSAIVHAETGSANPQGMVKIWGDVSRLNATETQILITTGNVTVRGGYTEGTFSDALRSGRSKIDAASTALGDECRVIWIGTGADNTTLDSLEITGGKSGNGSGNQTYGAAGIWIGGKSRLTNLVVQGNSTIKSGGGVIPYSGTDMESTTYTEENHVIAWPAFRDRPNDDYRLTLDSPAVDVGTLGIDTYLVVMSDADKVAAFGGVAGDYSGYTMYYVPLKSSNLYDKGLDVIVHLGGFVPDPADYLENYIYTTDLAGKPRLAAKEKNGALLIDAGAYEFTVSSKGTVFLLR